MALHDEGRLQALLARFEDEFGDALRQRRAHLAAGRAFMRRFRGLSQELVRPLLDQLSDRLHAQDLATGLCGSYTYDDENSAVAERLTLPLSLGKGIPKDPDAAVAGLSLSADGDSRQVRLAVRSLVHPEVEHVSELPLLEQWSAELIEEEILTALEQVLCG